MASDNLKRYIWDTQIVPQLGYSFSDIHSFGYSLIALQMMNLEHHYPSVFWQTACLSVNASADEESDSNKGTNYGKISAAISKMQKQGINISPPLINKANFGFTPDPVQNQVVFGLKGINGIGDVAHDIIEHRPYASFEDFYVRMYETKIVTKGQFLKLIKAGSFNEFGSQIEIMKQFLIREVNVKDKLNGQNLARVISLGLFDSTELISFKHLYNFKSYISKKVHKKVEKPKDKILILDVHAQSFFFANFTDELVEGWHDNKPLISEKKFKKAYDLKMAEAMELLAAPEFARKYNQAEFMALWNDLAQGSTAKWQMESTSYYEVGNHELAHVDYDRYRLVNFFELSEEPIVLSEKTAKNGRVYKNVELYSIIGTVLDKDKNKHTITVLTPDGVLQVRTYSGAFSHYDKQISTIVDGKKTVLEKPWTGRGTLLLLNGFRRGDVFNLKADYGDHTINKITQVNTDGTLQLQSERVRA